MISDEEDGNKERRNLQCQFCEWVITQQKEKWRPVEALLNQTKTNPDLTEQRGRMDEEERGDRSAWKHIIHHWLGFNTTPGPVTGYQVCFVPSVEQPAFFCLGLS